ncbi:MAG: ABC transporter ATP-binding protein [Thermoanaerobaculia bacterium]
MNEIVLSLKNVSKIFKKSSFRWQSLKGAILKGELIKTFKESRTFSALENVNLEIYKGETFGIIGENGAGKSTILKLFANILKPTRGEVFVSGRTAALIELGAGFHPEISGEENVIINGIILGLKKKEIRELLPTIVEFSEIGDFIKEPVKIYSSGMYARLGFAIAAFVNAPILLVDEVLAVGDEHFQKKCIAKIKELQLKGKTIVFVSHDLSLVSNLCHRVCHLEKGKVKKIGTPAEVINDYKSSILLKDMEKEEVLRYGDRRVLIEKVYLEGDREKEGVFKSEGKLEIKIIFKNKMKERDLVFGIAFSKDTGDFVYGTNTGIDNFEVNSEIEDGCISFVLNPLSLTEGNYFLDVAAHSFDGFAYDYWKKCLNFRVESEIKDIGGFRPLHRWEIKSK